MNESKVIQLRAHHLLCLQGFQGYGYNQDFADNMADILRRIDADEEIELEITSDCDSICLYCPHCKSGICQKEPGSDLKVREMDNLTLKKLNLKSGHLARAQEIIDLVNEKFESKADLKDICGDCAWKKKCMHFI